MNDSSGLTAEAYREKCERLATKKPIHDSPDEWVKSLGDLERRQKERESKGQGESMADKVFDGQLCI